MSKIKAESGITKIKCYLWMMGVVIMVVLFTRAAIIVSQEKIPLKVNGVVWETEK